MARVLNDQAQVELSGDVYGQLNLRNVRYIDRKLGKAAESTTGLRVSKKTDWTQTWGEASQPVLYVSAGDSDRNIRTL